MTDNDFQIIIEKAISLQKEDYIAIHASKNRVIDRMIEISHQESDRIEHHLIEMPLSVIIYQWVIIRLKTRPWRLLVPTSIALSLFIHGILPSFNIFQLLFH